MSEIWKQYEGQMAAERYPLERFVGGTEHSAVFLTEGSGAEAKKAVIKFIPAGSPSADKQLFLWSRAAQLSHANLLRIQGSGRCRLGDMDLLYVVTECAEEDLSQVVPQRALTEEEARGVLEPLLDVLVYLHGKGFAHTRLKPQHSCDRGSTESLVRHDLSDRGSARKVAASGRL